MNEPEKYVNEEGVEEIFSLLKDEFDSREDVPVTDNEIINIMETDELDQKYVSQVALQRALNEELY